MSVSAIGSAHSAPVSPERMEGPGKEHDGDSDDVAVNAAQPPAPPPGTGLAVNKTA